MCRIEGLCLDCVDSESCPMLLAHKSFLGTLKSAICFAYRPATPVSAIEYSSDILSSAELVEATSGSND
jgi:hypothetical protein